MALEKKKTEGDIASAPQRGRGESMAENLLPGGLFAGISDFAGGLPSSRYRQGKAQMIADAMGYETPFEVKHPALAQLANAGIGAIPGGLLGFGLGALTGKPENAAIAGTLGLGLGGTAGALVGNVSRMRRIGEIKRTLADHLARGETLNPRRPSLGGPLTGSGSMDAGNVDAYIALKNKERINPRTFAGSIASEVAGLAPYGLGLPLASLSNRAYAKNRLLEDAADQDIKEKAASALRNLFVKKAAELRLDSFISKVASALPVTKRAAFRVIQTQLATGDSLPSAIKVAFPRLDAKECRALAINFCKCAVADANKMTRREPESYNVPAKDAASTMKKCAADRGLTKLEAAEGDQLLTNVPSAFLMPTGFGPRAIAPNATKLNPKNTQDRASSEFTNNVGRESAFEIKAKQDANLHKRMNPPPSTPTATGYTSHAILDPIIDKLRAFHTNNPYVLPGLGIGAAGLGAYGLYNAMKKKRRRPEYED